MKKMTGFILSSILISVLLSGCYSRACDQPNPPPMNYKGEVK